MLRLKLFLKGESGAVTIDWVALGAGILLLGIATVYAVFNNGVSSVVAGLNKDLQGVQFISVGAAPSFGLGGEANADDARTDPSAEASTLCNAGTCFSDTDGDGFADQRSDGNSTISEPNNIPMDQLVEDGFV